MTLTGQSPGIPLETLLRRLARIQLIAAMAAVVDSDLRNEDASGVAGG